jgi:hypothetical protein
VPPGQRGGPGRMRENQDRQSRSPARSATTVLTEPSSSTSRASLKRTSCPTPSSALWGYASL